MRVWARRYAVRLLWAPALVLGTACTLLNPLDYLQSGSDSDSDSGGSAATDGAPINGEAASKEAATGDVGPGCAPARWSDCNATLVATSTPVGSATFGLNSSMIYFTNPERGEILSSQCTGNDCTPPKTLLSGESTPDDMAQITDSLFWTTSTAVRRAKVVGADADVPVPETVDTLNGPARIATLYPEVLWTDTSGARGLFANEPVATIWNKPSLSPAMSNGGQTTFFVSEGAVKQCVLNALGNPGAVDEVPTSTGATAMTWTSFKSTPFGASVGIVAARPFGNGSQLSVLDLPDEAGAPLVLSTEPNAVVALRATASNLYWTTSAGEFRRYSKVSAAATTVLHGLSNDTRIAVTDTEEIVLIADRGGKQVLLYIP